MLMLNFLTATKPPRRRFVEPRLDLLLAFHPTLSLATTMTSRISIQRPQGPQGGYQPDPNGFSNSRPSSGYRAANPDEPIEKLRAFASTVEDNLEIYSQPLKPHLPAIGRFLIVITFLEDSLRIVSQWSDQLWYLQRCACTSVSPRTLVHTLPWIALDTGSSPGGYRIYSSQSMLL